MGFPGGSAGKEPTCQCRRQKRLGFDPWVRKIPWIQSTTQVCIQTHFRSHLPGSSCPGLILELVVPWPVYPQLQSLPLFLLCPPVWTLPPELILETSVLAHLTYPCLRIPGLFESLLLIDLFSLLVRQLDSHLHSFPVSLVPVSS